MHVSIYCLEAVCVRRDCKVYLGNRTLSVQGTLTDIGYWTLCSTECRVKYIKRWLRVHFEQGQVLGNMLLPPEANLLWHPFRFLC